MSMEVNNNSSVSKSGVGNDLNGNEKFEFKQVQVGSIFLKDNGDGKISIDDFSHTTGRLTEFLKQYVDNAADWSKDTYNAIVGYLNKNKDDIKADSINETISSFQAKAKDKAQIAGTEQDGDWTVTNFKDGTFMRENKNENKVRYYDEQGRWVAGTNTKGAHYKNTYVDGGENLAYAYISEEIGNSNIFYYSKDDDLLFSEDGKERATYIKGPDGKLKQVEVRDIKTNKLTMIGYADENEEISKTKEFKKDPVSNKEYVEETDYKTNKTMKIFDAVVQADIFEVKDPETGKITYKKVVDHKKNTVSVTENGITTTTDMNTGEVTIVKADG